MTIEMTQRLAIATLKGTYPNFNVMGFFEGLGLGYFKAQSDEWKWYDGISLFEKFTTEELIAYAQMCLDSWEEE